MGKDLWVPVKAPPDTLARMAQAVGVTPELLEEAGRGDAAEELRELPPAQPPEDENRDAVVERLAAHVAEQQAQIDELQRQVKEMLDGRENRKSG